MQRRHRLRNASDFGLLQEHGRRYHHRLLILVVRRNEGATSRFAFSASRRVGKATSRNRIKRVLRETVRQRQREIADGYDCLFIARQAAGSADAEEIRGAAIKLLERARVCKGAA